MERIVQESQRIRGVDHMVSHVHLSVAASGKVRRDLVVDVKQLVGADFAIDPLEVSVPLQYTGPWDRSACSERIEAYYRDSLAPRGVGLPGANQSNLSGNIIVRDGAFDFEFKPGTGW
jgi:hypothetical protein